MQLVAAPKMSLSSVRKKGYLYKLPVTGFIKVSKRSRRDRVAIPNFYPPRDRLQYFGEILPGWVEVGDS